MDKNKLYQIIFLLLSKYMSKKIISKRRRRRIYRDKYNPAFNSSESPIRRAVSKKRVKFREPLVSPSSKSSSHRVWRSVSSKSKSK
jgi:hypothetical protein